MKLRDYQAAAVADIERRRLAGGVRVPIVLATGLGKTQIFTSYIDQWLDRHPGQRALVIAHTDELIEQAAKRMRQVAPCRRIGIVKAGRDETLAEIIVSSRQTLASAKRRERLRNVGLIVIDECHHAVRTNAYGKILDHFGAFDEKPPVFVLGVTATLARSDKAKLSSVWQECTFTRDILFGIRHGYLLDVRGERVIVPDLDLSRVSVRGGDYSESELGDELERTFAPEIIAKEYSRVARDGNGILRRGIAFWPLVNIAEHGRDAFLGEGIRAEMVHGGTPKVERRELLQRFHLPLAHPEAIDVMHNAMVLTEGFDEPSADVVVIARPTRAAGLYQQMVGRVLRPNLEIAPSLREKALILDVHGVGEEHGLRSLIDLSPERKLQVNPDDPDASLLEMDEYLLQIQQELEEQRASSGATFESDEYHGPIETKTFDPLGRDKVWGQTPAGHYFISAGDRLVFLADSLTGDPGTYDVVTCSPKAYADKSWATGEIVFPWIKGTEHQGLDLDMALSWGEDVAGNTVLTKRKKAWRREEPSIPQKNTAAREKLDIAGMTKGEVSELLSTHFAARRIDPLVAMITNNYRTLAQETVRRGQDASQEG